MSEVDEACIQERYFRPRLRDTPICLGTPMLMALLLVGCASLPTEYPKEHTTTIRETSITALGQQVQRLAAPYPNQSGFYLLYEGVQALAARLEFADKSEISIDVQYFLVESDSAGHLLVNSLVEAANRGVRVRILLDDISTEGYDQMFGVLSANPNVEIRLTNPFANRRARQLDFATDFQRLNHRMHNKSITFDNAVTIVGGRNIANEYFWVSDELNFRDLDVVGFGPVAAQVSTEFDTYWNAPKTVPVTAFVDADASPAAVKEKRDEAAAALKEAQSSQYADALNYPISNILLAENDNPLVWAPAQVVNDLPDLRSETTDGSAAMRLTAILIDAADNAERELLLVSPYFVPGASGVERFRQLRERGVRSVVLTNSLASTDVVAAYGGYSEYQKSLLGMGVELWEVKAFPNTGRQHGISGPQTGLHAKTFVVDRRELFVGSFNWDSRSKRINTEMGILIKSEGLGEDLADSILTALPRIAWRLELSGSGEISWLDVNQNPTVVYSTPPQTGAWRRFLAWITQLDALEGQL